MERKSPDDDLRRLGPIVLASQSPRRREILQQAGIPFVTRPADVDETQAPGEPPVEFAKRLAREKAEAVRAALEETVLGADTVVVIDGDALGKPRDAEDAAAMLRRLSGREHEVITGVCVLRGRQAMVDAETTRVRFVRLTEIEIAEYVESGEPMDKAGAYAIQGLASKFIDRVEGCYFNVVGLPVALVYRYLKSLGVPDS